ncbi:MAG: MltA domain-containing protein [Candidatus Paracaedimonas acanthamoebae]|mgnify:CR=1 FL=1|uniref:peptidoglycan lytic exotransglycosylase n=1 Tax=Candidatus Paracaedimonas acanthamoebae TaxID=244581 RepID=A0A8J7PZR6_9PROT|nr:MltA domain-containing protein [Candidatus Paracaedimonas acanthamoebae]
MDFDKGRTIMTAPIAPITFQKFSFQNVEITNLPGFSTDTLDEACLAWNRSAAVLKSLSPETSLGVAGTRTEWEEVLRNPVKETEFREFLTSHFKAYHLSYDGDSTGLFTGYFEPSIKASMVPSADFPYPVYGRPQNLVVIEDLGQFHSALAGYRIAGTLQEKTLRPYYSRRELSSGCLEGHHLEIAWVANKIDLYFMHIQGSGKLEFEDHWIRVGYDGTNGYPYTSIGKYMVAQGFLTPENATMKGLKAWLQENPKKIDDILNQNDSFVFFKNLGAKEGPLGRQGAVLTPKRSLAVDPRVIALGMPLWLSAESPCVSERPLQRFMVAQDVGGAIKGPIRGDFYWGTGDQAGSLAGDMKSTGELYFLIPKTVEFKGFNR